MCFECAISPLILLFQQIQVGLFEALEQAPSFIHVPIHTNARSKCMMRCKGKVEMEEANSLAKVSWQ